MIINLYRHRGYIWRTALADLRTQYAGSVMGVVWNVLQPLAMILVFWTIFGNIVERSSPRASGVAGGFAIYLCSALLPWLSFGECVARGTNTFVSKAGYLRKLPIPEQVFVAQTVTTAGIGLGISYSLLVVIALLLGSVPTWHWLLLPIPLGLLVAFGFGIAMALGTINAFIRDTAQIVPIALRIGFWGYPIVYPIEIVPAWFERILPFNPVYSYLESVRLLFLWQSLPPAWMWASMLGWSMLAATLGYLVLRSLRAELRDVV